MSLANHKADASGDLKQGSLPRSRWPQIRKLATFHPNNSKAFLCIKLVFLTLEAEPDPPSKLTLLGLQIP